jgi:ribosomal protein L14
MITKLTNVKVVDSSGAGWVQCFHIYRGFRRRYAGIGDFIKGAVKRVSFYPKYRRGKRYKPLRLGFVVRGLVVQTKKSIRF